MTCPKCGGPNVVEVGCSRRGFRRLGGVLDVRSEPVPCRNNGHHKHFVCMAIQPLDGPRNKDCGHRWTR